MSNRKTFEEQITEGIDIEAVDGDEVILSVPSFSNPGEKYMVTADFGTGLARCTCKDAVYRDKIIDFTDGAGHYCKHLRAVAHYLHMGSAILRAFKKRKTMEAFEYQPGTWPDESTFMEPADPGHLKFLRACGQSTPVTALQFRRLCGVVLEEYGLPNKITRGSAEVLVDWFKNAPARHKREAERIAWRGETFTA